MKKFLIRLFNLEKPECPSCLVYKEWMVQLRAEADNNISILTEERNLLHEKLGQAYQRLQEDKEAERQERQALEDTILRYTKMKGQPQVVVKASSPAEGAKIPIRPGTSWSRMKYDLEAEARRKSDQFKNREHAEVLSGKLAPEVKENLS